MTASVVVGFWQLLRPALRDGRQPQVQHVSEGEGEGTCTGKHSFLIAGRPMSWLWHGEYSMGAHPFFSPLPNTGTLSLLQIQLFSQVPSDVAFHFPDLSILLPPPETLCFLVSQVVSALSNLTYLFLGPQAVSAPQPRD